MAIPYRWLNPFYLFLVNSESEMEPMDFSFHPDKAASSIEKRKFYKGTGLPFRFICSDQTLVLDIEDYEIRIGRGEGFPYVAYNHLEGNLALVAGSNCDMICDPSQEETELWPLTGPTFVHLWRLSEEVVLKDIRLEVLPSVR